MEYGLTIAAIFLGAAIGGVLVFSLSRQFFRSWKSRRAALEKEACLQLLIRLNHMDEEEERLLPEKLKASFNPTLIGALISEMMPRVTEAAFRSKLANLYDSLGLVERLNTDLLNSKSWVARAEAARQLGAIGHPRAVLPLIAVLQDKTEMPEVKNMAMWSLAALNDTRAISPLIEALGSADLSTGQPISDTIAQFGQAAVSPLIAAVKDSAQEGRRYWAVKALSRLNTMESVSVLLNALKDRSERVREAAAQALGDLKASSAIHALKEVLLTDPVPLVRERAAAALGAIGDEHAMEALKRGLSDMEYGARLKAMEALESMGEKSIPIFLRALSEPDERMAAQAATALERLDVIRKTLEELASGSEGTPGESFQLLVRVAKTGAVQTLARFLEHPDLKIRLWVCRVFRAAKSSASSEALVDAVYKDPDLNVRLQAGHALAVLHQPHTLPAIVHILKQNAPGREALLVDLTAFPQEALKEAAADLILMTKEVDREVRLAAVTLLGSVESLEMIPPLITAFKDAILEIRCEAARSVACHANRLEANSSLRGQVLSGLLEMLTRDTHVKARVAAAAALGAFRDPQTIIPLAESFIHADESYRDDIVRALIQIDHAEITRRAEDLLKLNHPKARAGVAWTLGMAGDKEEIPYLTAFLADGDAAVRSAAAGGLGCLGLPEAAPILTERLSDPNERVRASVVNALAKCGETGAIGKLLPMLKDPDAFVAARAALSLGVLGMKLDNKKDLRSKLRAWREKTRDASSRAAALAALVLLEEPNSFKECMGLVADPAQAALLRKHIAALSPGMQKKFFSLLSLNPHMLFETEPKLEQLGAHYAQVLHMSRIGEERIRAVEMVALMNLPDAVDHLRRAFGSDPEPSVRVMAFAALSKILRGKELVKAVIAAVKDPAEAVRSEAAAALKRLSPSELSQAKEHLIPLLDGSSSSLREAAAGLLVKLYEKNAAELAAALESADNKNRILGLLRSLGAIGDSETLPVFLKFAKNQDIEVRAAALEAGSMRGLLSVQDLLPFLEDPQEAVRAASMRGIAGQWNHTHLEALISRMQDPSARVRQALAAAMGKSDPSAGDRPKEILYKLLEDFHPEVKAQSLLSLLRLGDDSAAPAAAKIMAEMERGKKTELLNKLQSDGVMAKFLNRLKNDPASARRKQALEFLAALDLKNFTQDILSSLQDPSAEVRVAAVMALAPLKEPYVKEAVDALSYDPVEAVRTAVKWSRLNLA